MRACSCTFLAHNGSPLCITWQPLLLLLCWQVKADGSPAERVDKHPFCMSRVFYDATEKPEEVRRGSTLCMVLCRVHPSGCSSLVLRVCTVAMHHQLMPWWLRTRQGVCRGWSA